MSNMFNFEKLKKGVKEAENIESVKARIGLEETKKAIQSLEKMFNNPYEEEIIDLMLQLKNKQSPKEKDSIKKQIEELKRKAEEEKRKIAEKYGI